MPRPALEAEATPTVPRTEAGPSAENNAPYRYKPTAADITRFLDHVRATGRPETFPTICRTPPPEGSRPYVVARFSVDRKKRPRRDKAPCAICSPFKPKFLHNGYLVWYPDEGMIRAIGPECGDAVFGGDQYARAKLDYDERERFDRALQFLLTNVPKVPAMLVADMKIEPAAREAASLYKAFKGTAPNIHERLRAVRKAGGTLKVSVVVERPKRRPKKGKPGGDEDEDRRPEGPRGFGKPGSDFDSYEVVVGQLPDSPILNSHFNAAKEWEELHVLLHEMPRGSDEEDAFVWLAEHADSLELLEELGDRLRRCAELYLRLSERLDRVAQFFTDAVFRSIDEWGRHPDGEYYLEATVLGLHFVLEHDAWVSGEGWQRHEREKVVLRPNMERLLGRGQWPGFQ